MHAAGQSTSYQWVAAFSEKGFREVIRDRDRPWGDYGERPRRGD